ncbi:MAG: hypothetical protein QXG01_04730 [Candidatus Bathyarchaeia archaeon]
MSHKAKYVRLLESNELNLWHRNVTGGSKITVDVYRLLKADSEALKKPA